MVMYTDAWGPASMAKMAQCSSKDQHGSVSPKVNKLCGCRKGLGVFGTKC